MMKRLPLSCENLNNAELAKINYFLFNGKIGGTFAVKNGEHDILVTNMPANFNTDLNIEKNANVKLSFFANNELKDANITINCAGESQLDIYFADFSKGTSNLNVNIVLKEEKTRVNWHLASLTSNNYKKNIIVSVIHEAKQTYAKVDNYGVCKDNGKVLFAGTSSINNGCVKCETYQNAKIMVFDKDCVATAKPILKIDENDIIANHAAVVGKVNDEHLFYLTSRGLSEEQAKQIITFGYLKPILQGFIEDEIKDEITALIEGRM